MPIARIQLPDGRIARIEVPEGTTPQQAEAFARQAAAKQAPKQRTTADRSVGQVAKGVLGSVMEGAASVLDLPANVGNALNRGLTMGVATVAEPALRGLGFGGAANYIKRDAESAQQGTGQYRSNKGAGYVTTALPETESSQTRFAGNMLGAALVPVPMPKTPVRPQAPKVTPRPVANAEKVAARETVQAGKQAGVRVMTSDVRPPKTFMGKAAQNIGERIPFAGTGGQRAAQQVQRVEAVKNILATHGADDLGAATEAVAADLTKTRGAMIQRLAGAKNGVIEGIQGAVPVPQASKAIDEQIARLSGINADKFAPVIRELEGFKAQLASGKSLQQIEGNRKLLGDLFKDPNLAAISGDGQKALNAIYGPLRSDMGNFIRQQGGEGAFAKWNNANKRLSAMAGELDAGAFKAAMRDAETTPEKVANLLFSKKPSDVRRLVANLSPAGRQKAQSAILAKALEQSGGMEALSVERFTNAVDKLSRPIGMTFQGAEKARLEGLVRVLKATRRASEAAVSPPTGVQAMPYALGAGYTTLLGPVKGILAAGGTGLLARAYESAPVRDALLKLGRTPAGSAREAIEMQRVVVALTVALESQSGKIARAANENVSALAAQEQEQQQQPAPQP